MEFSRKQVSEILPKSEKYPRFNDFMAGACCVNYGTMEKFNSMRETTTFDADLIELINNLESFLKCLKPKNLEHERDLLYLTAHNFVQKYR